MKKRRVYIGKEVVIKKQNGCEKETIFFILDKKIIFPGTAQDEAREIAGTNDRIAKTNIGQIFSGIYASMFGGKVHHPYISESDLGGEALRGYRPDVIKRRRKGDLHTEIKASQRSGTKFVFHKPQISQYSANLLRRAERQDLPEVNFGFFRYWLRRGKLNMLSNYELITQCASTTGTGLVIPLNLFFLAWSVGKSEYRNHTTSRGGNESAPYFAIPPSFLTSLIQTNELLSGRRLINQIYENYMTSIEKTYEHKRRMNHPKININRGWLDWKKSQAENAFDFADRELALEGLQLKMLISPRDLEVHYSGKKYPVKQFPIAVYSNDNEGEWLQRFKCNHKEIMEGLKIPNYYIDEPF